MTHCNDQLIDQLLTQAEQEGRCLIPPSTAIRKALLRRTGGTVVSPMPGLFARKTRWDELNRAQRHCEIIRALAIIPPIGRSARFRQLACWGSRSCGDI